MSMLKLQEKTLMVAAYMNNIIRKTIRKRCQQIDSSYLSYSLIIKENLFKVILTESESLIKSMAVTCFGIENLSSTKKMMLMKNSLIPLGSQMYRTSTWTVR